MDEKERLIDYMHELDEQIDALLDKRLGLWVTLCPQCHAEIHADIIRRKALKRWGQKRAMDYYIWSEDEFRQQFGKSYLEE